VKTLSFRPHTTEGRKKEGKEGGREGRKRRREGRE
jgi:hypothetical protein